MSGKAMMRDEYRTKEIVELLLALPGKEKERWATELIFRALETGGLCRYLSQKRLNDDSFAQVAVANIEQAYESLSDVDRRLFLRVMLLMPWARIVRDTGLLVRADAVLDALSRVATQADFLSAVDDVISDGPKAIQKIDLNQALLCARGPETGMVVEFSHEDRKKLRISKQKVVFDRLEVAIPNFRPYSWEANLRHIIPRWLDRLEEKPRTKSLQKLLSKKDEGGAAEYRILGLLDWMCEHPKSQQAEDVLGLGLKGAVGSIRKAAAALAAKMEKTEVLENMIANDPDKSVKKRAQKLLNERSTQPLLLF